MWLVEKQVAGKTSVRSFTAKNDHKNALFIVEGLCHFNSAAKSYEQVFSRQHWRNFAISAAVHIIILEQRKKFLTWSAMPTKCTFLVTQEAWLLHLRRDAFSHISVAMFCCERFTLFFFFFYLMSQLILIRKPSTVSYGCVGNWVKWARSKSYMWRWGQRWFF